MLSNSQMEPDCRCRPLKGPVAQDFIDAVNEALGTRLLLSDFLPKTGLDAGHK